MKKENLNKNSRLETTIRELGAKPMSKQQLLQSEKLKTKAFQTKKYREGLKLVALMAMKEMIGKHPDWPLNIVISKTIEDINPDIPSELLLEVVSNLIANWEKRTAGEAVAA